MQTKALLAGPGLRRLAVIVPLLLAACDGAGPGTDGVASIAVVSAPTAALIGAPIPEPTIVELRSASGEPVAVAGIEVTASAFSGEIGGTTTARTNAEGRAVFSGLVVTGGNALVGLQFSCCDLPAATHTISLVQGSGLLSRASPTRITVRAGSVISPGPKVRLVDAQLQPVAGAEIAFSLSAGGTLAATSVETDANGEAEVPSIELTALPMQGRVFAALVGTTQSVWFEIIPTVSGDMELVDARQYSAAATGSSVQLPVVRVTDGGPVIGATVLYRVIAGDGTISSSSVPTGVDGRTAPPTLDVARGATTIEIIAPGYTSTARMVNVIGATGAVRIVGGLDMWEVVGPTDFELEDFYEDAGLFVTASDAEGALSANYPMTIAEVGDAGRFYNWGGFEMPTGAEMSTGGYIRWMVPMSPGTYEMRVSGPMVETPLVFRATRP